jgi:ketosteroid isomerase-like protein
MAHDFVREMPEAVLRSFEADDPSHQGKGYERGRAESLRRQFLAMGAGDVAGFVGEWHPDIELEIHAPAEFPFIRRARGVEAVQAAMAHNFAVLEQQAPRIERVVAQGDVLDVLLTEKGRVKATGRAYDVMALQQFVFRDEKVAHFLEIVAFRNDKSTA